MLFSFGFQQEGSGALTVHPYWVVVSIIQFLLLFYLLRRFLWGPILRTLRDRAAKIREGLALAEQAKADREHLKAEIERLPVNGRRWQTFALLTPTANSDPEDGNLLSFRGLPPGFPLCPRFQGLRFSVRPRFLASTVFPLFSVETVRRRLRETRPVFLSLRGAPVFLFLFMLPPASENVEVHQDGPAIG